MKYSIHIGLNKVNPAAYGGWSGKLDDCVIDKNNMQALANKCGYQVVASLSNDMATRTNIGRYIKLMADMAKPGDRVLITYSGHGGQLPDLNGDEPDGLDETWACYDGQLIDDELNALLALFKKGVLGVVFSDSCHSGTMTRMMPKVKKIVVIQSSWLLISGCQDPETSASTGQGGRFTTALLEAYNPKPVVQSWWAKIISPVPKITQKPNMWTLYETIQKNIVGQSPNWFQIGEPIDWKTKEVF